MTHEFEKLSDEAIQAYLDNKDRPATPPPVDDGDLDLYRAVFAELGSPPPAAVLATDVSDAVMAQIAKVDKAEILIGELPSGPGVIVLLPVVAALLALAGISGGLSSLGQAYGLNIDHQASLQLLQYGAGLALDAAPLMYGLLAGGAVALIDRQLRRHKFSPKAA